MAATVDFTPISTIGLYFWVFVVVLLKAMALEDELPGLMRMVAEFIDVKTCVHYLIMMFLVNHGTTSIEKIRRWHIYSKCLKDNYMRGSYYKSYAYFELSKICKSATVNAATHKVVANPMPEKFKALTWTDKCSHPDTTKEVVDDSELLTCKGKNICSGNDTVKDEVNDHAVIECSKSDECIIIPVNNVNHIKNVDLIHEQNGQKRRVKTKRICTRKKRIICEENKQSTKAKISGTFEFDFTAGALLAVKPSKKAFLLVVLILSGLSLTATAPIQQDAKRRSLYEYKLLLTSNCNYRDIIISKTCHTNEEMSNTYIDYCGFANLCDPGFKPICVNGDDGGMLHICSPRDLTCPKGYRRRVWLNGTDSDVVLVQEEKCPQGWFQSDKSNCYDACLNRHEDIKYLPEQFAIYSKGDNISPTWIYCDFEKGFYNMDGKFLLAYDEQFKYSPYFCTSVSFVNPCASGQYPLPNGTCVMPCEDNLKRDAYGDFKCIVDDSYRSELVSNAEGNNGVGELQGYSQTLSMATKTDKEIDSVYQTTQNPRNYSKAVDSQDLKGWHIILIIALVGAALLAIIVVLIIVVMQHQDKHKQRKVKINNENKIENKTVIHKVEGHVNIFSSVNIDEDNEDQPFMG